MRRIFRLCVAALVSAFAAGAAVAQVPDLSGLWTNASLTNLERPTVFRSLELTDTEAAAYERSHPGTPEPTRGDAVGQDGTEWWEMGGKLGRLGGRARSSWIVDPEDGRLPYSPAGLAALQARQALARSFDNPEARPPAERCLMGLHGSSLPPMMNTAYNNHLRLVQTRDHLVIVTEMHLRTADHPPRVVDAGARRVLERPFGGPLGGAHARRGDHGFPPSGAVACARTPLHQLGRQGDGAVHAHRSRRGPLPVRSRRPSHLQPNLAWGDAASSRGRADIRIRLPRRQLLPARDSRRRSRRRTRRRGALASPLTCWSPSTAPHR